MIIKGTFRMNGSAFCAIYQKTDSFFVNNKVGKLFTFSLFCVKIKDSLVLCGFYS